MNRLQIALKNAANGGVIPLQTALKIARQFDEEEEESVNLLKAVENQVGIVWGEPIARHLAAIKGLKHNAQHWDLQDRNGEQ